MNRRQFLTTTGAAGVAAATAASGKPVSAAAGPQPVLMKLGDQTAPTNDTHLKYLARYSVRNICGYPQIEGDRLYATVDELKRMIDMAGKYGISIDCTAPPFLESSYIDTEKHPAIMLAESPERDRDIEQLQTFIRNCAQAGIPSHQIQHEHSGRAAHRPHAGPRRRALSPVEALRGASRNAAHARRRGQRRPLLGAHHLLPRSRHSRGQRVQDPHGLPSAGSRRAARGLPGRESRARHHRRPEEVHHHPGEPVSRPELLPGNHLGRSRRIRARKSST